MFVFPYLLPNITLLVSRATGRLQRGVVPLDGDLLHMAKAASFFIFFIVSLMMELTFGCCKNSKSTCDLPGFLSRKKDFWVVLLEWLDRTFGNVFWIPSTKPSTKHPGFLAVFFSFREVPRGPSDPSSSHLKYNVFGSTCGFSDTRLNRLNRKVPMLRFSWNFLKKDIVLKFLTEPFRIATPKVPFQG